MGKCALLLKKTPSQLAGTPLKDFTYYANLPKTEQNPNGGTLFCKNDDALNPYLFVGEMYHTTITQKRSRC